MKDEINKLCRLPDIDDGDAAALWQATAELTRSVATLRDLIRLRKLDRQEIQEFVRAISRPMRVSGYASKAVFELAYRTRLAMPSVSEVVATPEPAC